MIHSRARIFSFLLLMGTLLPVCASGMDNPFSRQVPRPLEHHPGNIFLAGEDVGMKPIPGYYGPWRVRDIDGKIVAEGGEAESGISPGKLPVGFYFIEVEEKRAATLAVLAPLVVPPPSDGPICVQTSFTSQFILGRISNVEDAMSLVALAGVSGIRDNAAWPWQIDEQGNVRTDGSPEVQSFELLCSSARRFGLDLLIVVEPGTPDVFALPRDWGVRTRKKFSHDLRDYARFVRSAIAKGGADVSTWEAWNEPEGIGGTHIGSEIVSAMKVFSLAARSACPDVRTAMGMGHVPADSMSRNGYLDAISSYHYHSHGEKNAAETKRRALDGFTGNHPVWVTEASYGAYRSGDGKTHLSPEEERRQASDIPKIFARSLHAGNERIYYFLFPDFGETAGAFWGVLGSRRLEPRPAFQALAATARLLAGARPAGRAKDLPDGLEGWVFYAKPDGKSQGVLVLWGDLGTPMDWTPPEGSEVFDLWGRRVGGDGVLKIGEDPCFIVIPEEEVAEIPREPVQNRGTVRGADLSKLCPVVADFRRPDRLKNHSGGYFIFPEESPRLEIDVYNFASENLSGIWKVEPPDGFEAEILKQPSELSPEGKGTLLVELRRKGAWNETSDNVTRWLTVRGDYGNYGESLLSIPFVHCPPNLPTSAVIPINARARNWQPVAASGTDMEIRDETAGIAFQFLLGPAPNATIGTTWAAPVYTLRNAELPPPGTFGIGLNVRMLELDEGTSLELNVVKSDGAAWRCPLPFVRDQLASQQGMELVLPLSWFAHISHRIPDATALLKPEDISALEVVAIGLPETRVKILVSHLRWLVASPESAGLQRE